MEKKILCVDDEPFNLDILEVYLEAAGYQVQLAENGTDALRALTDTPTQFSAVLLDRMMPDMEGLEVLHEIRQRSELDGLPVILQSALASKANIQEGLEAGAHYYLTKPFEKDTLLAVVKTAVSDFHRQEQMRESIRDTSFALQLMEEGQFCFRTTDEARLLAAFLSKATPSAERTVLGLTELMLNAVEHGNLNITYDEKTHLLNDGELQAEIERRLGDTVLGARKAKVTMSRVDDRCTFEIIDEGNGFDWHDYFESSADRVFDNHGRGILLANQLSFDEIAYQGKGNHVIATLLPESGN